MNKPKIQIRTEPDLGSDSLRMEGSLVARATYRLSAYQLRQATACESPNNIRRDAQAAAANLVLSEVYGWVSDRLRNIQETAFQLGRNAPIGLGPNYQILIEQIKALEREVRNIEGFAGGPSNHSQ